MKNWSVNNPAIFITGAVMLAASFFAVILIGPVAIPYRDVWAALTGGVTDSYIKTIVLETRLPMAISAAACGMMFSVAGLMMQTLFHNPLAGPSVLGISSGASFGVALFMLGAGGAGTILSGVWQPLLSTFSAMVGGMATIAILFIFSSVLRSGVTLLIVGIMISYLCSSGISLLNYFSPAEEIRNYLVWGLGSFSGLRLTSSLWLLGLTAAAILPSVLFVKSLNALLLGERYLESVGFSAKKTRGWILVLTGFLVAVPTAFCGPIGFIGLIVPHLCRLVFRSSNHLVLLPGCILFGALLSLVCAIIGVLPSATYGVLPINVITPIIGVPVILYLLLNRNRLPYFS